MPAQLPPGYFRLGDGRIVKRPSLLDFVPSDPVPDEPTWKHEAQIAREAAGVPEPEERTLEQSGVQINE
jgi:hypothetical protein